LFEQETGATVEYVLGNPADNLTKLLAAPAGDPPFDVMQVDSLTEATLIEKGLIDKVDHAKLPMNELFAEAAATKDYGPAFTLVPVVITWSPAKFKDLGLPDPTSFDDLLAPALKGKVAYPGMAVGFSPLVLAGLADAWFGDKSKAAEVMTKLKTIEPRIYGATAEMSTWLTNGEVVAAVTHTSQVQTMKNQGFDLGMVYPKAGEHRSMVYWNMPEIIHGTKNQDMALKWMQANLSCDAQRLFGLRNGVLPTCKAVAVEFGQDPKLKTISVTVEDMAAMFQVDPAYILANREAWNASWNQIMGN
jgi:ABC-type Fe3+ transport system substrate-binding protein